MKIVTHNGHFHSDELLAVAALLLIHPDAEVVRSRDEEVINSGDIVVDVGQVYDPAKRRFDHHQTMGAGQRFNSIPYASFGLVWKEFGEIICGGVEEAKLIEERLVIPIDAIDNGINIVMPVFDGIDNYTIGDFFESFCDGTETLEDFDNKFKAALPIASDLLKREIARARKTVKDWKEVERIYHQSENKKIIILPSGGHWKRVLIPTEAIYAITSRADGQWAAQAVPKVLHSFELKRPFPSSWAGLKEESLAGVSGVKDAMFCHKNRYLVVAKTQEGAIKLAEIALNS